MNRNTKIALLAGLVLVALVALSRRASAQPGYHGPGGGFALPIAGPPGPAGPAGLPWMGDPTRPPTDPPRFTDPPRAPPDPFTPKLTGAGPEVDHYRLTRATGAPDAPRLPAPDLPRLTGAGPEVDHYRLRGSPVIDVTDPARPFVVDDAPRFAEPPRRSSWFSPASWFAADFVFPIALTSAVQNVGALAGVPTVQQTGAAMHADELSPSFNAGAKPSSSARRRQRKARGDPAPKDTPAQLASHQSHTENQIRAAKERGGWIIGGV